jgi:hypothetical protein
MSEKEPASERNEVKKVIFYGGGARQWTLLGMEAGTIR